MINHSTKISIAIAIAGFGVLLSPIPLPFKIAVGASSSLLCLHGAISARSEKERLANLNNRKAEDLSQFDIRLRAKESELITKEEQLEAIASLDKVRRETDVKALKLKLEQKEDAFWSTLEFEEKKRRARLDEEFEEKRVELEQKHEAAIASLETELSSLEQYQQERKEQVERELELMQENWEKEKEGIEKEMYRELEEAENVLVEQYTTQRDELVKELQSLEKEIEKQAKQQYQDWLVPHFQEMDAKIREIEALRSQVLDLRDQIAENQDIKLSRELGTVHGDRSNLTLMWLKKHGFYADYDSSVMTPDGTFILNFVPWEVGAKSERLIKGLLNAIQADFGLTEPPTIQPNGEARAWCLTEFARNSNSRTTLGDFYVQRLPEVRLGETFQDLEPALRDGIAKEINYQNQVAEMMAFTPPTPISKPRSHQITELEMTCCKWFYFWRGLATEGKQENVTTREGLLYNVYGVREGRASATHDPILCESLGQRVKRILEMLKVEAVAISQESENG